MRAQAAELRRLKADGLLGTLRSTASPRPQVGGPGCCWLMGPCKDSALVNTASYALLLSECRTESVQALNVLPQCLAHITHCRPTFRRTWGSPSPSPLPSSPSSPRSAPQR